MYTERAAERGLFDLGSDVLSHGLAGERRREGRSQRGVTPWRQLPTAGQ